MRVSTYIVVWQIVLGIAMIYVDSAQAGTAENKTLVQKFVEAGNSRNYETIDEIVSEKFVRHCQATPDLDIRTREQFKEFMRNDAAIFPDSRSFANFDTCFNNRVFPDAHSILKNSTVSDEGRIFDIDICSNLSRWFDTSFDSF